MTYSTGKRSRQQLQKNGIGSYRKQARRIKLEPILHDWPSFARRGKRKLNNDKYRPTCKPSRSNKQAEADAKAEATKAKLENSGRKK